MADENEPHSTPVNRLPVNTYHCRYCSHLLLATTRRIDTLPRRKSVPIDGDDHESGSGSGGLDCAIILPLARRKRSRSRSPSPSGSSSLRSRGDKEQEEHKDNSKDQDQKDKYIPIEHVTILLSTIFPNPYRSIVRRADGFEKRIFLRCGRCQVFMGYFLDAIHFPRQKTSTTGQNDEDSSDTEPRVVYILPGALVDTSVLADGDEAKLSARDGEWKQWFRLRGNFQPHSSSSRQ